MKKKSTKYQEKIQNESYRKSGKKNKFKPNLKFMKIKWQEKQNK